ncbi:hypothetical protein C9374_010501 [Naegleria lovaniensis]|uniref:Uncharacterized protein n=1 Tax=Naegleria lovaniensis TaxID=51637 RepID=A0AA88GFQ4_NAELO|nr:uncharacterized protein C9374_010501 [Naegleria lovaniensis]KAG2374757.1 hypothetical protein C9374_010501 [Naegleria lovaniensis]
MSQPPFVERNGNARLAFKNQDFECSSCKPTGRNNYEIYDQLLMICQQSGPIFEIGFDDESYEDRDQISDEFIDNSQQKEVNLQESLFENQTTKTLTEIQNEGKKDLSTSLMREEDLDQMRVQLDSLQQHVACNHTEMIQLVTEFEIQKQVNQELRSSIHSAIQEIEGIQQQLKIIRQHETSQHEEQFKMLQNEAQFMKNSMNELKITLDSVGTENSSLTIQLESINKEIESLKNTLKTIQNSLHSPKKSESSKNMKTKLKTLTREKDELMKKFQQLQQEVSSQKETLKLFQEQALSASSTIEDNACNFRSSLQVMKHEMNSQLEDIQNDLGTNKDNVTEMKESLSKWKEESVKVDDAMSQWQTLQKEYSELRKFTLKLELELKSCKEQTSFLKVLVMVVIIILVALMAMVWMSIYAGDGNLRF